LVKGQGSGRTDVRVDGKQNLEDKRKVAELKLTAVFEDGKENVLRDGIMGEERQIGFRYAREKGLGKNEKGEQRRERAFESLKRR